MVPIWAGANFFRFMSDSRHENESGLIIDPALLAGIQAACRRRAAELDAATSAESRLSSEQEAERFAAPFQTCRLALERSLSERIQLNTGNWRVPRTGSSAKRVLASVASFLTIPREP